MKGYIAILTLLLLLPGNAYAGGWRHLPPIPGNLAQVLIETPELKTDQAIRRTTIQFKESLQPAQPPLPENANPLWLNEHFLKKIHR